MLFSLVPGGFSYLINYIDQLEFKLEKILGFRNTWEKLTTRLLKKLFILKMGAALSQKIFQAKLNPNLKKGHKN